jgi:superfamily II DNA or RNA helicase
MILRPYQHDVIEHIENTLASGIRRVVLSMPTGSGKTVTAAAMIHAQAQQGRRSLFIVDRVELVDQAADHLNRVGLNVGILQGDRTCLYPDDEVVVASIQTIRRRNAPIADFIIIDEANILHKAHIDLMQRWNNLPFVGLSATPLRQDLGEHFETLVRGPSVRELTEQGYLVPAKAFCPSHQAMEKILADLHTRAGDYIEGELSTAINRKELVGDIVKTWQDKASDRRTLCFAVDIAHSKSIVDAFRGEGIRAEHLDAYTHSEDRREVIQGFKDGEIQILSSVNVLGVGFDVPDASCGILARPTLSEAFWICSRREDCSDRLRIRQTRCYWTMPGTPCGSGCRWTSRCRISTPKSDRPPRPSVPSARWCRVQHAALPWNQIR